MALRAALLLLTAAVGASSILAFTQVHRTAQAARTQAVPAILAVSSARASLVAADQAAIHSFKSGEVHLTGAGEEYRSQLATVSQNLAQAAENNAAGEAGSRQLQLVEGLLAAYAGTIDGAAANLRQNGDVTLAMTDLWYANELLHQESDGILPQLDHLLADQQAAFEAEIDRGAMSGSTIAWWLAPTVWLFALLGATQIFLSLWFRRAFNAALLLATLCLLGLTYFASLALASQHYLAASKDMVDTVVNNLRTQTLDTSHEAQRDLLRQVGELCNVTAGDCGYTLVDFAYNLPRTPGDPVDASAERRLAKQAQEATAEVVAATENGGYAFLLPLTAGAIMLLIVGGLQPRIDEYRYRSP